VMCDKKINLNDQTISCVSCQFVAPLSITFEDYQKLHDRYVLLARVNCYSAIRNDREKPKCVRNIIY